MYDHIAGEVGCQDSNMNCTVTMLPILAASLLLVLFVLLFLSFSLSLLFFCAVPMGSSTPAALRKASASSNCKKQRALHAMTCMQMIILKEAAWPSQGKACPGRINTNRISARESAANISTQRLLYTRHRADQHLSPLLPLLLPLGELLSCCTCSCAGGQVLFIITHQQLLVGRICIHPSPGWTALASSAHMLHLIPACICKVSTCALQKRACTIIYRTAAWRH